MISPSASLLYRAVTVSLVCSAIACGRVATRQELIDRFSDAACVPPSERDSDSLYLWRETIKTQSGLEVQIRGISDPTGRIDVQFADGQLLQAVNPGDFFAPTDVRVDATGDLLFVKAQGSSVRGGGPQTWLFEYDLRQRQLVEKLRVDPFSLPSDCR